MHPTYTGTVDEGDIFRTPSLYEFAANDNFDDRNLYINGDIKFGKVARIFSEATGAMVENSRDSLTNKEYQFFYNSADDFDKSVKNSSLTGSLATGINYIDSQFKLNYQ